MSTLLFGSASAWALTTANPPSFTFVLDENGADDQPGQKDLTSHAAAGGTVGGDIWVAWRWDIIALSGSNTGDACALFDTDGDFKVNFAVCVTIEGRPAQQSTLSPRVYTCGDDKVDRCTSPIAQVTSIDTACTVTNGAPDAFHSGQTDTQATCHIALDDVGGVDDATLVNTCSYPSQQPNSDPSDCVLIPRDAFIRIVKVATPDQGSFDFNLDGAAAFTASGSDASANIAVTSRPASHSVSEIVPANWALTSASCTGASGTGSSNGTVDLATATISGIVANSDNVVTCTFNDQLQISHPAGNSNPDLIPNDSIEVLGMNETGVPDGAKDQQMTFTLYAEDCIEVLYTETMTVNANGVYSTHNDGGAPNGYRIVTDGVYNWGVHYNGDSLNDEFTLACGDEYVLVDIQPDPPPP